ncbi:MAG: trypsin-like peptidase domain-containing protein [Acidobacteria bacterium]|nr:trypsin-like peptidase domain-containing protein [Acidobacteriota bacterium]
MQKHPLRTILITVLLTSAATIAALQYDLVPGYGKREVSGPAFAADPVKQPALTGDEEINVNVYNTVSPSVVNITKTVVEYDFFFAPIARGGSGSGCLLDNKGNVLTNYHVIESADRLEVSLPDRSRYRAKIIGVDPQNDLAVIQLIDAPEERLHPISFGNSDSIKVGQKVLAIGNPLGLQNTLTVGIVSSVGRRIQTESGDLVDNVIQTDAAINPGNSGGPLLNTSGEMIGINTSIFTIRGGGNIGIGFAIPSNTIRRVAADLMEHGRVLRPSFGADGYSIYKELAYDLDLPVDSGLLVARVYPGGSAEKAGIRGADKIVRLFNERILAGGDIITEIEGRPVSSWDELRLILEPKRPGDIVEVTLYRDGAEMTKSVTLLEPSRRPSFRF